MARSRPHPAPTDTRGALNGVLGIDTEAIVKSTVIGCGRLGAPYLASLAGIGHHVLGLEIEGHALARMRAGQAPFDEPGLGEAIASHTDAGTLSFTDSYDQAAAFADLHFVCVPTPQRDGAMDANLTHATDAIRTLAAHAPRDCLIVLKSSVPVGTCAMLATLAQTAAGPHVRISLAYSPDFLRESTSMEDATHPTRIVVGLPLDDPQTESRLRRAWAPWIADGVPLLVTDWATAELAKSAANGLLATKISYVNMIGALCEASGADVQALTQSLALDPRIGSAMLDAGLGFGGSCIPKDIRALLARGLELGVADAQLLREVEAINIRRRQRVLGLARQTLGGSVAGHRIAVWGAAYKPGTDDVRDSPALAVARELAAAGATVVVHDPKALPAVADEAPDLQRCADLEAALDGAQLLLHLTDWPDYRHADPARLVHRPAVPRLIDARATLSRTHWAAAGWHTQSLGVAISSEHAAPA